MITAEIYNYIKIDDELITGGQPTADQLRAAAAEGFTTVINLRANDPQDEMNEEARLVQSLGMAYHHIPVVWENPQPGDFFAFEQLMLALPPGKTLLHCFANYRVTAFYSIYARRRLGWSPEQAAALRARIWAGSDYPIWERFIADLEQFDG